MHRFWCFWSPFSNIYRFLFDTPLVIVLLQRLLIAFYFIEIACYRTLTPVRFTFSWYYSQLCNDLLLLDSIDVGFLTSPARDIIATDIDWRRWNEHRRCYYQAAYRDIFRFTDEFRGHFSTRSRRNNDFIMQIRLLFHIAFTIGRCARLRRWLYDVTIIYQIDCIEFAFIRYSFISSLFPHISPD